MIRCARENDYSQVETIMGQVHGLHVGWRPDIYRAVDPVMPHGEFQQLVEENRLLVAEENGLVVGRAAYLVRTVHTAHMVPRKVLFVETMAVEEAHRGRGIGRKLMGALKAVGAERGYDGLELQVNAKNTGAREMYEKCGFTEKSINMELL